MQKYPEVMPKGSNFLCGMGVKKPLGRINRFIILLCILLPGISATVAAEQVYTDISLHYYNRFFPLGQNGFGTENFRRFHVLREGLSGDNYDVSFNFNLYEAVDGPMADHTLTPYTVESTYRLGNGNRIDTDLMVLVDVYHKDTAYLRSTLQSNYRFTKEYGNMQLQLVPGIQLTHNGSELKMQPTLGAEADVNFHPGVLRLGVNMLDAKDQALMSGDGSVITAQYQWPTWGNNSMSIGANASIGSTTESQDRFWLDFHIFFDHLFGYRF